MKMEVVCVLMALLLLFPSVSFAQERAWPVVTGTFIQPNAFFQYTEADWEEHFENLLEAGMDTVILQWIAETPYGKVSLLCYDSEQTFETEKGCVKAKDFLPNVLEAARNKGIRVFVGLNIADEWWQIACSLDEWNQTQAQLGGAIAQEIWDRYKKDFPETLYGWYFPWEMFNGMYGQEEKAASFLNLYLHTLDAIDPTMPMMLSPFVRSVGSTAEKAREEWTKVFAMTDFRNGDIFCCQDAVGAGHIEIEQMEDYFIALKNAADTKEGLLFWANNECFNANYTPADLSRFVRQLQISDPYVTGHVTFAYSHYYSPDYTGFRTRHNAYVAYYNTGKYE